MYSVNSANSSSLPLCTSTPDPGDSYPLDSIKTEYHPSSNRPTRIENFEDYREYDATVRTSAKNTVNPWLPFKSRTDFEFAELALDACLNERQISKLLQIVHRVKSGEDTFNIGNYKDLCNTWDKASDLLTPVRILIPLLTSICTYIF